MEYLCTLRHGSSREQWIGKLTLLQKRPGLYEAEISGRGTYFHVLTGRHNLNFQNRVALTEIKFEKSPYFCGIPCKNTGFSV